jgi:hypothetical protein
VLIVVNLVAVTLESVPDLAAQVGRWFERSREPVRALDAHDMHALMDRRRRIVQAHPRGGPPSHRPRHRQPQGDVVSEELKEIEGGEGG